MTVPRGKDTIEAVYPFIMANCECTIDVNVGGYPFRFNQKEIATGLLEWNRYEVKGEMQKNQDKKVEDNYYYYYLLWICYSKTKLCSYFHLNPLPFQERKREK